jgi:hypothetical protein
LPHLPQLELSVRVEMHAFPHAVSPYAQVVTHLPFEHSDRPVHGTPHEPQFLPSIMRSVHLPSHSLCPGRHAHFPLWQIIPPLHRTPQAPQFCGSADTSTHVVSQNLIPAVGHDPWQTPATHIAPGGHLQSVLPGVLYTLLSPPPGSSVDPHPEAGANGNTTAAIAKGAARVDERARLYRDLVMTSGSS